MNDLDHLVGFINTFYKRHKAGIILGSKEGGYTWHIKDDEDDLILPFIEGDPKITFYKEEERVYYRGIIKVHRTEDIDYKIDAAGLEIDILVLEAIISLDPYEIEYINDWIDVYEVEFKPLLDSRFIDLKYNNNLGLYIDTWEKFNYRTFGLTFNRLREALSKNIGKEYWDQWLDTLLTLQKFGYKQITGDATMAEIDDTETLFYRVLDRDITEKDLEKAMTLANIASDVSPLIQKAKKDFQQHF